MTIHEMRIAPWALLITTLSSFGCSSNGGSNPSSLISPILGSQASGGILAAAKVNPGFDPSNFVPGVTNPYLPLVPGTVSRFAGQSENIRVEVLSERKTILGVLAIIAGLYGLYLMYLGLPRLSRLHDADRGIRRCGLDADLRRQFREHADAREDVALVVLRIGLALIGLVRVGRHVAHVALEVRDRLRVLELALVGLADVLEQRIERHFAVATHQLADGAVVVALQVQDLAAVVVLAAALEMIFLADARVGRAVVDLESHHDAIDEAGRVIARLRVGDACEGTNHNQCGDDPHFLGTLLPTSAGYPVHSPPALPEC